jgi:cytidine deaminase
MSERQIDELIERMFTVADHARVHAYVPHCNFPVGACLKGAGPALFAGANIENAVLSQSVCAETAALGAMIVAGERHLSHVLIVGGRIASQFCPPCGGCRQRLAQFGDLTTMVHLCTSDGRRRSARLSELLPYGTDRNSV